MLATARTFLACQAYGLELLHASSAAAAKDGGGGEEGAQFDGRACHQKYAVLLGAGWEGRSPVAAAPSAQYPGTLDRYSAVQLSRVLTKAGALGKRFDKLLAWLVEACGSQQANLTRSKALKTVAALVEQEPSLLQKDEVHRVFEACFTDESISVREAAVNLIGRMVGSSEDLAMQYFPLLVHASNDAGVSVRKHALKVLWKVCLAPGQYFPRAREAAICIMVHASDPEDSIQAIVTKAFTEMWFTCEDKELLGAFAKQIVDVVWDIYQSRTSNGSFIDLPLSADNAFISLIGTILAAADKKGSRLERRVAQKICANIADSVGGHGTEDCTDLELEERALQPLLALHAFCTLDGALVLRGKKDPHVTISSMMAFLAPLEPKSPGEPQESGAVKRRRAEQLLCAMSAIFHILQKMQGTVDLDIANKLQEHLKRIITTTEFLQVVVGASKLLCALSAVDAGSLRLLLGICKVYQAGLEQQVKYMPDLADPEYARWEMLQRRRLFTVSQLWSHGAALITAHASNLKSTGEMANFMLWFYNNCGPKLQQEALRGLGFLMCACPDLALKKPVMQVLNDSLSLGADVDIKLACLQAIIELLHRECETLIVSQREDGKSPSGRDGKLDTKCGQNDKSVSGAVIQYYWERKILPLAMHVDLRAAARSSPSGLTLDARARYKILELSEGVLKEGLVAPWTAISMLVALSTDRDSGVSELAKQILDKYIIQKRSDLVDAKLGDSFLATFNFQRALAAAMPAGPKPGADGQTRAEKAMLRASKNLSGVYRSCIPRKSSRLSFFKALLRPFSRHIAEGSAAGLQYLAFLAQLGSFLPFSKEEEVLTLIHLISPIITQHADSIQSGMDALKGQQVDTSLRLEDNEPQRQLLVLGQKATAACLLLLLKQQLQANYALSDAKLIAFSLSDNKSHHRVVQAVSKPLNTKGLPLGVSVEEALKQCKMFKKFLSESEAQMAGQMLMANEPKGTPSGATADGTPSEAPEEPPGDGASDGEGEAPARRRTRRRLH